VSRFILTPSGDIDGMLLGDGPEIHLPPHLSTQIAYGVRPGDTVVVHGVQAIAAPVVEAASITDQRTGQSIVDNGSPRRAPRGAPPDGTAQAPALVAQGQVQRLLHGPRGEVNGALLSDGTMLRLPPDEAQRYAALLQLGQPLAASGPGAKTQLGTVIAATEIGPSAIS